MKWFGQGSLAISGFDKKNKAAFDVIPKWIAKFIVSDYVVNMSNETYLTVGIPKINFNEIKGERVIERLTS